MMRIKKGLCLVLVVSIITMFFTITSYGEIDSNESERISLLYEGVNESTNRFEVMNNNPDLLNAFFEENYDNAEILSTTVNNEVEEIWKQMGDINTQILQIREAQEAAIELGKRLTEIQKMRNKFPGVSVDEGSLIYSDSISEALNQLSDEEITSILNELNGIDPIIAEEKIDQYMTEYEELECRLSELGAVPTEEELSQTLFSEQSMNVLNSDSEIMTVASPPDFHMFEDVYALTKSYCVISISGKQYNTYTVRVRDKADGEKMYRAYDWFDMYKINTFNSNSANEFLGYLFEAAVVGGVGAFTAPYLGTYGATAAKWVVQGIFALIESHSTTVDTLYTNKPTYQIKNNNTAEMKFVYVQDSDGEWHHVNSANRAEMFEAHHFSYQYYDCSMGVNRPIQEEAHVNIFLNGRFYTAEIDAANWFHQSIFVEGISPTYLYPAKTTIGSIEYIGKQNGKTKKTTITPFYAYEVKDLI